MMENSKIPLEARLAKGGKTQKSKIWKIIIYFILLLWIGFFMAEKIDLATADLGRHIKNGEWVVEHGFDLGNKNSPVHENFYSYTHPDFPVVNHHWGSGVIFFYIWKFFGFSGLSLFYILLSLLACGFFFWIALRESSLTLVALFSFFLAPLMAERAEIRPEVFSVFFASFFFFLIWQFWRAKMDWKWLLALVPLQIAWVNSHVYFFLGPFLVGIFWFFECGELFFRKLSDEEFAKKIKNVKILTGILFLVCLASLANPFGFEGFLYPLKIFGNYGYTIVENKSVWFVENYGLENPNFASVKAVLTLFFVSFSLLFAVDRKRTSFPFLAISIFFGIMGWMAIRNMTLLGFFALPVLSYNFQNIFRQKEGEISLAKENGLAVLYIILAVMGLVFNYQYIEKHHERSGVGNISGIEKAASFIEEKKISGPVFNNYDIGGYFIFFHSHEEKVFVDNRPEAYPVSFFEEVYKPMQNDEETWKEKCKEYGFNAIVFYRNDVTPWGRNFLDNIILRDREWAKVFGDKNIVIYLRRNEKNKEIIEKNEIISHHSGL